MMSSRWLNLVVLLIFLLTVPAGVFFYFTSPGMGYPKSTAGIIAAVLALIGLALLPVALRRKPSASVAGGPLPAKAGWGVLIGFLIVMAAVVAYFMLRDS
jgi:membrane protein YdbS with pleckstrin-like domain